MNYSGLIELYAEDLKVSFIYKELLKTFPQFKEWSGSHRTDYHHYGSGGLIRHTFEVIDIGLLSADTLRRTAPIDRVEYFLSALFHDTGKMFDYEPIYGENGVISSWGKSEHKRLIYHIPRSIIIWHDIIQKYPELTKKYEDRVIHNILSHHGQREYGSPVAPKTREAWLLHLSDSISARMDDANKMDVVNKKE